MKTAHENVGAKVGEDYWSNIWKAADLPTPCDPHDKSLNNTVNLRLHEVFIKLFGALDTKQMSLMELGCAQSQLLPYFAKEFGFKVSGLDYSKVGCEKSRAMLHNAGIDGDIVYSDMFSPPHDMKEQYDVVFTYGLVEHFDDTAHAVRACSAFLKPGGVMITIIPNLTGLIGFLQKHLGRDVYDIHVPLDCKQLHTAHEKADLDILKCDYLMFVNNSILVVSKIKNLFWLKMFQRFFSISSKFFWILERLLKIRFPANKMTSPYIICVARKKGVK